jgi:hypothetical protein
VNDRVEEFGELFAAFVRTALEKESRKEPEFRTLVSGHLGTDPTAFPIVALDVPDWDHANLQFALEALFSRDGTAVELVGIAGGQKRYMALSLSDLINEAHFRPGPVEYESIDVGPGATHPCILFGLALLDDEQGRAVILVRRGEHQGRGRRASRSRRSRPMPTAARRCSTSCAKRCGSGTSSAAR